MCDQLSDLINCFDLLWDEGEEAISSFGDSPGVFPQNWLPPQLSYTGLLEVTGVRFDVIVRSLFCAVKSVCFGAKPVVSDVTEDGDRIPMTTSTHSWGGESGCSEWLQLCCRGRGLWLLQLERAYAPSCSSRTGDGVYLDCIHSAGTSWESCE